MSTAVWQITQEQAQNMQGYDLEEISETLAKQWPLPDAMSFKAYDWCAGEDAEVFCLKCAVAEMVAHPEREVMPMGTVDCFVGEEFSCECGFIFELPEDDPDYEAWMRGEITHY